MVIIMYRQDGRVHFSRIIGKPGESIEIRNHHLYRDDRRVNDKYAKHRQINNIALRDIKIRMEIQFRLVHMSY